MSKFLARMTARSKRPEDFAHLRKKPPELSDTDYSPQSGDCSHEENVSQQLELPAVELRAVTTPFAPDYSPLDRDRPQADYSNRRVTTNLAPPFRSTDAR